MAAAHCQLATTTYIDEDAVTRRVEVLSYDQPVGPYGRIHAYIVRVTAAGRQAVITYTD